MTIVVVCAYEWKTRIKFSIVLGKYPIIIICVINLCLVLKNGNVFR